MSNSGDAMRWVDCIGGPVPITGLVSIRFLGFSSPMRWAVGISCRLNLWDSLPLFCYVRFDWLSEEIYWAVIGHWTVLACAFCKFVGGKCY